MKINNNRKCKTQSFDSIRCIGEVFEWANEIFMTIEEVSDCNNTYFNAICLSDGELAHFNDEEVQVLNNVVLEVY